MKKFKIIVEHTLELPDDFVVGEQPEGFPCLRRGSQLYEPTIQWLVRKSNIEDIMLRPDKDPGLGWDTVSDDTANEFIQATADAGYRIKQV
jgi:hypothetical protein